MFHNSPTAQPTNLTYLTSAPIILWCKDQRQQRHAREQPILHLSEIRRALIKIDFLADLRVSREWMHHDHAWLRVLEDTIIDD